MQLHSLKRKTKRKTSQQVGRGGTRGKTSGRGTKGQNARAGRKKRPELRDFIKRIPKMRGRGISGLKSFQVKALGINLSMLDGSFNAGETVSPKTLLEKNVTKRAKGNVQKVKILGNGEISKKLVFEGVELSSTAKSKIEAAGGTIR